MIAYRSFSPCTLLSPVPVVMVSARDCQTEAKPNILTAAWAGTVNSEPPMVSVSIRRERYTHGLITRSGEFVLNLVSKEQCGDLDYCGVKSGRQVDKFAACQLQPMPAVNMDWAPAVEGAPAYLACKVRQVLALGSHDMIIGEVVGVQVREDLFSEDGSLHLERCGLVCYTHGVYQRAEDVLGFFGYYVARPAVLRRRMEELKK